LFTELFTELGRLPEQAGLTCGDVGHRHESSGTQVETSGNRTIQRVSGDATFVGTVNRG
jgi:hypothetical protein